MEKEERNKVQKLYLAYQEFLKSFDELQDTLLPTSCFNNLSEDEIKIYMADSISNNKPLPDDYTLGANKPDEEKVKTAYQKLWGIYNDKVKKYDDGFEDTVVFGMDDTKSILSKIENFVIDYQSKTIQELRDFVQTDLEIYRFDLELPIIQALGDELSKIN